MRSPDVVLTITLLLAGFVVITARFWLDVHRPRRRMSDAELRRLHPLLAERMGRTSERT